MNTNKNAEELLRVQRLQGDRRQAAGGIVFLAATTVLLSYNDFRILGTEDSMMLSYIYRGVYVVLALGLTFPVLRSKTLTNLELWIKVNLIVFAFATLAVNWIKVPISADNLMLSAAAIVLFFVLFPLPMKRQLEVAAIMVGVGLVVFIGRRNYLTSNDFAIFLLGYVFAIGLGILLSSNGYRARAFELKALLGREKALNDLAEQQQKVQVLEGLLKICSECKKIHDTGDTWIQMEEYISGHSEADFSHGLCPSCYDVSMAELDPPN